MSRSSRWLVAAGVIAFLLVIVANVPASFAARWLPAGASVQSLSGTVWNGQARILRVAGIEIEKLTWRLHPLPLIAGRVSAAVEATRPGSEARAEVVAGRGRRLEARHLFAEFDAAALTGRALPAGWAGPVRLRFERIVVENGWLSAIRGSIETGQLSGPSNVQAYLGSYRLDFGDDATASPGVVVGHFRDTGGPSEISGTLRLTPDRRAVLSGWVRARPGAPPAVVQDIASLPQSDPQGRRLFSFETSF